MEVTVTDNNIEKAIFQLRKAVMRDGILEAVKAKRFFLSRTQRRKVKDMQALRRLKKRMMRQQAWRERQE